MKVVSWNVNSVKARGERLEAWLTRHTPDVVCLQELKVQNELFPWEAMEKLGYHAAVHGQKAYNGVAILARAPLTDIATGLLDDGGGDGDGADAQARLVAASVNGVRVLSAYVPNGSQVGSDKYAYKLAWLKRLRAHLQQHYTPQQPLILAGDFNVAPRLLDVARPEAWEQSVLCCPEVRAHLEQVASWGLVDVFAKHHPEGGVYSWWDYRMLGFPKNNGLRIDLIYATDGLACKSEGASVDREERKGSLPSDHAPVVVNFHS